MTASRAARIQQVLASQFLPDLLVVRDDSGQHAGHEGARPGGQTHYAIDIVCARFKGLSRVARHRLVYDALAYELSNGLHALQINARTPQEHTEISEEE